MGARQLYIHTSITAEYANVPCWLRCVPLLPNMPRASTPTFRRYRSSYSSKGIPPLHRLLAHQHDLTARNLVILGEYRIKALNSVTQQIVSGDADYVLGYDPFSPLGPKRFESCAIIVEAKRKAPLMQGWHRQLHTWVCTFCVLFFSANAKSDYL